MIYSVPIRSDETGGGGGAFETGFNKLLTKLARQERDTQEFAIAHVYPAASYSEGAIRNKRRRGGRALRRRSYPRERSCFVFAARSRAGAIISRVVAIQAFLVNAICRQDWARLGESVLRGSARRGVAQREKLQQHWLKADCR